MRGDEGVGYFHYCKMTTRTKAPVVWRGLSCEPSPPTMFCISTLAGQQGGGGGFLTRRHTVYTHFSTGPINASKLTAGGCNERALQMRETNTYSVSQNSCTWDCRFFVENDQQKIRISVCLIYHQVS